MSTKRKPTSDVMPDEPQHLAAIDVAAAVRAGRWSAVDVFDRFVGRIEQHNPALNALVAERLGAARRDAQAIDEAVARGEDPGPLAGLPFTTKEMASAEGLPVTAGSLARSGAVATRDATYIRRAREAGAVLIGVTNQSELGLWWESVNPVYGRTNNPYDRARTPGGSSGGEGALVGGGLSAFGIGSDMGGSIRLPAFFCGIYGHKPTGNVVPISGHYPLDHTTYRLETPPSTKYISIGPMSRNARDLLPILNVISGACPEDPYAIDSELGDVQSMAGKRIYVLEDPAIFGAASPGRAQRGAVRRSVAALQDAGADVQMWDGPSFRSAMDIYTAMLSEIGENVGLEKMLSPNDRLPLLREASRIVRGKGNHAAHALLVAFGERFIKPSLKKITARSNKGRELARQIDEYLGDDGLLVLPTFPRVAPKHGRTLLRPFDVAYTAIFNVTENPVTAVPTGLRGGLPTGVQIVGRRGNDYLPISAAVALQDAGMRWIAPETTR